MLKSSRSYGIIGYEPWNTTFCENSFLVIRYYVQFVLTQPNSEQCMLIRRRKSRNRIVNTSEFCHQRLRFSLFKLKKTTKNEWESTAYAAVSLQVTAIPNPRLSRDYTRIATLRRKQHSIEAVQSALGRSTASFCGAIQS